MTLALQQLREVLDQVNLGDYNILKQIKDSLERKDEDTYQKWANEGFDINQLFDVSITGDERLAKKSGLLHLAAQEGYTAVVEALIEAGADVDKEDQEGNTPLILAVSRNNIYVVEVLIKAGADINKEEIIVGKTSLAIAAQEGYTAVVEALIEAGADVDKEGQYGTTPLIFAAQEGYTAVVEALIEAGADVDKKDKIGRDALFYSAKRGYKGVAEALVKAKENSYEKIFLSWAVRNDDKNTLRLIIETQGGRQYGDISEDVYVKNVLCFAVENNLTDLARDLIEAGADVNGENERKRSLLQMAVCDGYLEMVEALIEAGADVDKEDQKGNTPLILAVSMNNIYIVEVLIKAGADVGKENEEGRTPLHFAAQYGYLEIVKALLENGADINAVNQTERTLFINDENVDLCSLLVNHIAKLEGASLYVSEENLQKKNAFINTSNERYNNYLQHLENCKKEVKQIKEKNGLLYDFLIENNVDKLDDIWEQSESVRSEFDNEENLKKLYPEYAYILINKADKEKKEIFLHNHKPLISLLSEKYKLNLKKMTLCDINKFFEIHKNDVVVEMAATGKSLIEFVDFKNLEKGGVPRLELYAFTQLIKNELADSKHGEAISSSLENSNAEAVVNQITVQNNLR